MKKLETIIENLKSNPFRLTGKAKRFYEESGLDRSMYTVEENIIYAMENGIIKYNHKLYIEAKKSIKR